MRFLIPLFVLFGTTFIILIIGGEKIDILSVIGAFSMPFLFPFVLFGALSDGDMKIFLQDLLYIIPWFLTYLTYANLKKKFDETKKDELEKEVERRLNEVKKNEESN